MENALMQSNKLKLIFILILAAFIFSCSKDVKEQKPVEAKVESSAKIEPKENEFLSKPEYNTHMKSPEQIKELEEKYEKSEEYKYEQKIKQLRAKVGIKPDFMGTYNPYIVKDIDLINNKLIIPASYENVQYVDVENIEYDGKIYRCTQKIEIKPETFLEYKMTLEYNPHAEVYVVLENELITPINIGKINETTIENQVNGEILTLKDDKDSIQLIKLFEDYEKENYPIFFSNMDKLKVLDYVKGNFTNSGYDEYVVFFIFDGDTKNYVNILHCFIVKNDKIIKEYPIILPYDEEYIDNRVIIHLGGELKYKFAFSTGFVADFNQNDKNELYFKTVFVGG
ncbi:clustered-type lipoprotein [Treponema putidum]|nr:clustered-type lipoprotein [Treponema putidum]